jgi:hypothetical protein
MEMKNEATVSFLCRFLSENFNEIFYVKIELSESFPESFKKFERFNFQS